MCAAHNGHLATVRYLMERDADVNARSNVNGRPMFFSTSRSEEHTSELQPLMRISYAVFCLKQKKTKRPCQQHQPIYSTNTQPSQSRTSKHLQQTKTNNA